MKLKGMLATVALVLLGTLAVNSAAKAQDDPGPAYYQKAMEGKRVVLVPLAMGFDLAQGQRRHGHKYDQNCGNRRELSELDRSTSCACLPTHTNTKSCARCSASYQELAAQPDFVGRRGLEPRTYGLKVHSSAIELAARR